MEEFIVYKSKGKQFVLSILGLIMFLSSFAVFIASFTIDKTTYRFVFALIGIIATVFFGWCEGYIIKDLFKGKRIIVLDKKGFYDYSSALATKDTIIPWDNIEKIEEKGIVGQVFVSVWLKDSETTLGKLSKIQKKAINTNVKMGFGEINITLQSAKGINTTELAKKMNLYLEGSYL